MKGSKDVNSIAKRFSIVICIATLTGCGSMQEPSYSQQNASLPSEKPAWLVSTKTASLLDGCDFKNANGAEIAFAEESPAPEGGAYRYFYTTDDGTGVPISYQTYLGKHAKIISEDTESESYFWRKILIDDCHVVYLQTSDYLDTPKQLNDLTIKSGFYFLGDYLTAAKLIGHTAWVKKVGSQSLDLDFGPDDKRFIQRELRNTEPVKIISIETVIYGINYEGSIKLLIKRRNSKQGLINFNPQLFYKYNPIKNIWGNLVISAIEKNSVIPGMTSEQARLSWGDPETINRTSGIGIDTEQWVYSGGNYLYFENGLLTTMQTSQ